MRNKFGDPPPSRPHVGDIVFFVLPDANANFSVFKGILFQKDFPSDGGPTMCHVSRITDRNGEEPCVEEFYVFSTVEAAEGCAYRRSLKLQDPRL